MYASAKLEYPKTCRLTIKGSEYRGTKSEGNKNLPCQRWDSQEPNSHRFGDLASEENYCRNPDDDDEPWCYTTSDDERLQFCGIPMCKFLQ